MNLFSICIIASVLLASCKSSTSITKRHYNKGYYIAHAKNSVAKPKQTARALPVKAHDIEQVQSSNAEEVVVSKIAQPVFVTDQNEVVTSLDKTERESIAPTSLKKAFGLRSIHIQKPSAEVDKNSGEAINNTAHDGDDDDGLSLFGFIILLVLILWALGFLVGGLGGIIHLLLVVALILLVLWLLRII